MIFSKVRVALRKGGQLMHVVVLLEASVSARVSCCWRSLSLGRVRIQCGYWSEETAPDICRTCLVALAERVTESVTKQGFGPQSAFFSRRRGPVSLKSLVSSAERAPPRVWPSDHSTTHKGLRMCTDVASVVGDPHRCTSTGDSFRSVAYLMVNFRPS